MDVQWQLEKCTLLNVPFCCPNNLQPGGPNVALTRPNLQNQYMVTATVCSDAFLM